MKKRHVIISGTGRAGTTFLVQLFTALGMNTGCPDTTSWIAPYCNSGMEANILAPNAPYIIKAPILCLKLDKDIEYGNIEIEHAFIPMRDLFSAAESRRDVMRRSDAGRPLGGQVPGGLLLTDNSEQQEFVLQSMLYNLMYTIAKRDIPMTLMHFPRMIFDEEYLYSKLRFFLSQNEISHEQFTKAFKRVVRPELVHDFLSEKNRR